MAGTHAYYSCVTLCASISVSSIGICYLGNVRATVPNVHTFHEAFEAGIVALGATIAIVLVKVMVDSQHATKTSVVRWAKQIEYMLCCKTACSMLT
jgi:hypothetical protein